MFKLPIRTWIRNAAIIFTGEHGGVTTQAQEAGCSRQTVYDHGRKLEERLQQSDETVRDLRKELASRRQELAQSQARLGRAITVESEQLRRFAVVAQAMGISLRQTEELLQTLLPTERVPDHSTLGRWTEAAGKQAAQVLAVLDPCCALLPEQLCVDEIFFGG